MPKVKKYKRAKKSRKRVNKSIYKSNINKQHVKVNVHTGSTPSGISYMQAPTHPNLTDIKRNNARIIKSTSSTNTYK